MLFHSENDTVCYCFGYTVGAIRDDYRRNRRSTIAERIRAEKSKGGCRCREKHPRGR